MRFKTEILGPSDDEPRNWLVMFDSPDEWHCEASTRLRVQAFAVAEDMKLRFGEWHDIVVLDGYDMFLWPRGKEGMRCIISSDLP